MAQVALNLNLPTELNLHIVLDELALVQDLERDDELRLLLPREIDVAKLAFAQRFPDFEVIDRPLAWVESKRLSSLYLGLVNMFSRRLSILSAFRGATFFLNLALWHILS